MEPDPKQPPVSPAEIEMILVWRKQMLRDKITPEPGKVRQDLPTGLRKRPSVMSLTLLSNLLESPTKTQYGKELEDLVQMAELALRDGNAEVLLCRDDLRRWKLVCGYEPTEDPSEKENLRSLLMREEAELFWARVFVSKAPDAHSLSASDLQDLWNASWHFMLSKQFAKLKEVLNIVVDVHKRFPSKHRKAIEEVEEAKAILTILEEKSLI